MSVASSGEMYATVPSLAPGLVRCCGSDVILSGQSAQVMLCCSEIQDGPMARRAVGQKHPSPLHFLFCWKCQSWR